MVFDVSEAGSTRAVACPRVISSLKGRAGMFNLELPQHLLRTMLLGLYRGHKAPRQETYQQPPNQWIAAAALTLALNVAISAS